MGSKLILFLLLSGCSSIKVGSYRISCGDKFCCGEFRPRVCYERKFPFKVYEENEVGEMVEIDPD